MNNRQVETSREIRLWITTVVVPIIGPLVLGAATIIASNVGIQRQIHAFTKQKIFKKAGEQKETVVGFKSL